MYVDSVPTNSAIGRARKYIKLEAIIEVIDNTNITCFLNLNILVHLSFEAKDAKNLIVDVSIPSFAITISAFIGSSNK